LKLFGLLLLMLLIFTCVAAYMLHQKGLLTRETLDLFVKKRPESKAERPAPVEPVALAASIQKREQALREESERLQEFKARLATQRRELEAERASIERQLRGFDLGPGLAPIDRETESLAKLVKMYEGMPPEEAASILESLPDPVVARLLIQMRNRQAAQIMGSLRADKAAEVSKLLMPEELKAAK
jgi:flagellar motility protein MotE (MotC chaperone)